MEVLSSVIEFLLGIFYERMKLKKKSENLKQIILAELTQFLATFILYSLKCYMQEIVRRINSNRLDWDIFDFLKQKGEKEFLSNRSNIKTIEETIKEEEAIKDLEEKVKGKVKFILYYDKKSKDETFGWIFALSKKYEKSFPKKIAGEIKDLQESIESFYDKLEKFHKGLMDGEFIEFIEQLLRKYRKFKPEIEDVYSDIERSKSITQSLTDLKDFDNGLVKELTNILSEMARLSSKKSKYSHPDFCIEFTKEIKPLILKIDEILEKERTNL